MSKTTHQIAVKAVDQTGGAFGSIASKAKATGASIRSYMGGALAAAGGYMSFKAVAAGINELGHLSDIAQKTATSVDELTQASTAMNVLGIQNMGVEQMAKAFDSMAKNTGRTGMAGFYETIGEIGKLPTIAERSQAAMKAFGSSGMEFMPLINAAENGTTALQNVINAMPKVPQAAADAGDACADAMEIANKGFKSMWLQGIGAVCGWFDTNFTGGVRGAAALAAAYMEYYAKVGTLNAMRWYGHLKDGLERISDFWGDVIGAMKGGAGFGDALNFAADQFNFAKGADAQIQADQKRLDDARIARWQKALEDQKTAIEGLNESYANAAKAATGGGVTAPEITAKTAAESVRSATIRNDLMMAGSNVATRAAILGPTYQSEQKKQSKLLGQIAENTKKTSETATDDSLNLGEI